MDKKTDIEVDKTEKIDKETDTWMDRLIQLIDKM
jgi:hypothetical protein